MPQLRPSGTNYSSSGSEYTPSDGYDETQSEPELSDMSDIDTFDEDSDTSEEELDAFGGVLDSRPADEDQPGENDYLRSLQVEEIEDQVRRFEENDSDVSTDDFDDNLDELYHGNKHPPEFYRNGIETMSEDQYTRKMYAKGTMNQIRSTENLWKLYCRTVLQEEDWNKGFSRIDFKVVYQFLQWYLGQRTNKNGRAKRRVRARQSLVTFWCLFRLTYQRATNVKIDTVVDRGLMHNGLVELGKSLEHNVRHNRPMTIDDLKLYISTTLCTTEKSFKTGELRILAVLFLLLLAPQGSRPGSMLELKFKDINILLVRDPNNPEGHPRLVVRLSLEFTKTYLGPKARKSFTVPEIMYDPSLLLSPHVFLLAIIFRYKAFKSPSLNGNPQELGQLRIHRGEKEMELAFRPDILNTYIFRKPIKTVSGYRMGEERLTQGMMSKWISTMGMLSGFEHRTMAYNLRYMAGNSLDRNVNISSALRDLVMDHAPNSNTFQKHYLERNVCADLWAIHRDREPQQALLQQATSLGHSVSRRRPTDLTPQQAEELKKHPRYQRLDKEWKASLPKSAQRRDLGLKRKALWTRMRKSKLAKIRDEWGKTQGVEDVERQIAGEDITQASENPRSARPMGAVQQRMFDALTSPLVNDLDAQLRRRTEAIRTLVAYCDEEDPVVPILVRVKRHAVESNTQKSPEARMQEIKDATLAAFGKVLRCFLCVAKAETLGQSHPRFDDLCRQFSRSDHLRKHFITVHLDTQSEYDSFACPICKVTLIHKKHLQNHTERVHGINTSIRRSSTKLDRRGGIDGI